MFSLYLANHFDTHCIRPMYLGVQFPFEFHNIFLLANQKTVVSFGQVLNLVNCSLSMLIMYMRNIPINLCQINFDHC